MELHILHTNDMHNSLTAKKSAFIKDLRNHFAPNVLLFDAGDAVGAGNLGARGAEPVLSMMADCGYDAMAMGNRESHPTRTALTKKLKDAAVPVLSANLRPRREQKIPPIVTEYIIVDYIDGVPPIAILGLAPSITPPDTFWAKVTDYIYDDPIKTGSGLSKKLKEEGYYVIALTHIGKDKDIELLNASPNIDLIIGGHSHLLIDPPLKINNSYIAATSSHAKEIGHLTINFGDEITVQNEVIPL